jgi:hypothetical protein
MSKSEDVAERDPILVDFDKEVFRFAERVVLALADPIKEVALLVSESSAVSHCARCQ